MSRPMCFTCRRRRARRNYGQCTRCLAGWRYWPVQVLKVLGAAAALFAFLALAGVLSAFSS